MPFAATYARRELIIATVIVVPLIVLAIWVIPGAVSDVLDPGVSTGGRVTAAAVIVFCAVAAPVVAVLIALAVRRLRGSSPGVIVSSDGLRAARQAFGFHPVVPWLSIDSLELQRTPRGQTVVAVVSDAGRTPLPVGLAVEPEELRDVLAAARRHSTSAQP